MPTPLRDVPFLPVKLGSPAFVGDMAAHFRWMHTQAPVCRFKLGVLSGVMLAGYEDCAAALKDPRLVRDRRKAGARWRLPLPVPIPHGTRLALFSMIDDDGSDHRRLRALVQKAFTPRALARLERRVESLTHELLDELAAHAKPGEPVDLELHYSLPIPVTVIREMLGIEAEEMPTFAHAMRAFGEGLNFKSVLSLAYLDLPRAARLIDTILARKRSAPGDDILSALVAAEERGDRLTRDELVSMAFLLAIAGYETTVHLITNGVLELLRHPRQLELLRESLRGSGEDEQLLEACVEEVLRYAGPVQGSKLVFASEDLQIRDVAIPKGTMIIPNMGAANRDPAVFERPDAFDLQRPRVKHLALGHGPHFCLGAVLARMEAKIALRNLLLRFPGLRLGVPAAQLEPVAVPMWCRYRALPLLLE